MRTPSVVFVLSIALLGGCRVDSLQGDLVVSADRLEFGAVNVGRESALGFTISNGLDEPVDLFSVTLLEGSESVWQLDRESVSTLEPSESLSVTVTFRPRDEARALGRVQVRSSARSAASMFVLLEGEGGVSVRDDDGDGYTLADGDCDDDDPNRHPGADEICDGTDTDCDGHRPNDEADADGDGFAVCEGDCDDEAETVHPGAPEICDGADTDCDGSAGDAEDADADGWSPCDGDCDDGDAAVQPPAAGLVELCDGKDNDCSGRADDRDEDGDGRSPCGAGDCDDLDPLSYPQVVNPAAVEGGDGSDAQPFTTVADALAQLDSRCRTVVLTAGLYGLTEVTGSSAPVTLQGRPGVVFDGGRAFEITAGADVTLRDLTIDGAVGTSDGGAISVDGSDLVLDNVTVIGASSPGDGGAVAVFAGSITILGGAFTNNQATDDGGAISAVSGSLTVVGTTFDGNAGTRGGAIVADGAIVDLADALFVANTAAEDGGAVMLVGPPAVTAERLTVQGNVAGLRGGGLSITNVMDPSGVLRNSWIQDNAAGAGGGLHVGGAVASLVVANNTLTGNTSAGAGAGLLVDATDASGLTTGGNVVAWSAGDTGFEVAAGSGGSHLHNTAFATTGLDADFAGDLAAGQSGNTVENPEFVALTPDGDPTNDDLSLAPGSPGIDSGPVDTAGPVAYPTWNDLDGSPNDRGADGGPGA